MTHILDVFIHMQMLDVLLLLLLLLATMVIATLFWKFRRCIGLLKRNYDDQYMRGRCGLPLGPCGPPLGPCGPSLGLCVIPRALVGPPGVTEIPGPGGIFLILAASLLTKRTSRVLHAMGPN